MTQQTTKCKCRTINLAKEGHTKEERKCKMLIYEKKFPQELPYVCGPPLELGLRENHPSAKRVRVCTAADIRTTCPPPLCTCPPAIPTLTTMQKVLYATKFGLKGLLLYSVLQATIRAGLWGDAKTTECLYVQMKNIATGTEYSCEETGAPRIDLIMHDVRQKYNSFVSCAFQCTTMMLNKVKKIMEPEPDCEVKKEEDYTNISK